MTLASSSAIDYDGLILNDRVHGRLYYDQAIFEEELEKIWYREWVYVGHESEIPESGDYRTRNIGLQPVIMTRDEDGGVHLLMNRCAHRGNTVCQMERGNSHAFRCAYHGWTFANDGHLLGVTYASAYGPDFNRDDYALTKVPRVGSYRGFIFGSLSPTGPSLDEHLGRSKAYIDQFVDLAPAGEISVQAGTQKQRVGSNWKMQVENSVDNYHAAFVHQSANELRRPSGVNTRMSSDETLTQEYLGGGHAQIILNRSMSAALALDPGALGAWDEYVALMEGHHGAEKAQQVLGRGGPHIYIFPNLILLLEQVRRFQPVSPGETYIYYQPARLKGAPDAINKGRLRIHEFGFGPASFVSPDDLEIFERNQIGYEARANEWLVLQRGIDTEVVNPDGVHTGHIADEIHMRGIWRHYKELMTRPSHS